jgi:hypothetical protein
MRLRELLSISLLVMGLGATHAFAEDPNGSTEDKATEDLAKQSQNPVADLISVPFQNNTNIRQGPYHQTGNILNIQPVIPFHLNEDWNLITRTIIPVVSQVRLSPNQGPEFGLGDTNPTLFLSPAKPQPFLSGHLVTGFGPTFLFPTSTDRTLGPGRWASGISGVGVFLQGPWVIGLLANNLWSFAGPEDRQHVRQLTAQYFINYNFKGGWYVTSSPIITADWVRKPGDQWTVPIGGGFGRVFKVNDQPINASLQAFYNVVRPDNGPLWQIRFQLALLFPTK